MAGKDPSSFKSVETYLKELVWRDYAQNVIMQFPQYGRESYREKMRDLEWRDFRSSEVRDNFEAWKKGKTGYPIVDAGMRELWATGWMHNRVRMITASFLIKHLLIDWREGEKWFWNTLGRRRLWQQCHQLAVGGGHRRRQQYVRPHHGPAERNRKNSMLATISANGCPELADLDDPYIHDPEEHGCKPDAYPSKIIAHKEGRERALDAYQKVK